MRILVLLGLATALVACATPDAPRLTTTSTSTQTESKPKPEGGETHAKGGTQLADAATTPLSDLNLVRTEIPAVLVAAQKGPYAAPRQASCEALGAKVMALDDALGPDLDAAPVTSDAGLAERGVGVVGDAAVGALRSAAEGVIPFRGWVRKLMGAERYSRAVAAAIAAGTVRRAFLKGLGQAQGCITPAAPRRQTLPQVGKIKEEGLRHTLVLGVALVENGNLTEGSLPWLEPGGVRPEAARSAAPRR